MAYLKSKSLKAQARHSLENTQSNPRMLVLLYTGVVVLLSLAVNGLNVYLDQQISTTGGLSGLGTRSILETIQTVLSYFTTLFSPFWQAGFLFCMIGVARQRQVEGRDMLFGCKRFSKILSHAVLQMLILMGIAIAVSYAATYVYILSPLSDSLVAALNPLIESGSLVSADGMINLDALPADVLMDASIPLVIIFLVLFLPVYLVIFYQLRLSQYLLVEGEPIGAFRSLSISAQLMKGHKWQMLKLDLSYWWYYLLEALLVVVCYLDVILPMLGVALPFNETVAYFVALILYGVLQIGFHLWKKCQVDLTYIHAYESIVHPKEEMQ